MDSNQKTLPTPPPPPPPPKKGNTTGRPPLLSMNLHDEGDGGAVGEGDMEVVALCHGSPRASSHELPRSGLEGGASSHRESMVSFPGRDHATSEERDLPRRYSRVVARLGLTGLGTVAAADDRPYACADCSRTFGRETALCAHRKSHKRDVLSFDSEDDAPSPKRRKRKSVLRTLKPLEAKWGKTERRNGCHKDAPIVTQQDDNSGNVINDDGDDPNPVIAVAGSHGSPSPTPDAAAAFATGPASAVVMATPMPAPHAATASVNIEGAPAAASTTSVTIPPAPAPAPAAVAALAMGPAPAVVMATPMPAPLVAAASVNIEGATAVASTTYVTIPPAPAPAAAATITRAPLATTVSVATQTASDQVKGNNGSGQAGARYRYGGNGKAVARNTNRCGNSLAGYSHVDYGKGVAGYSNVGYGGKGLAGCSSGSHTYSTSTSAGGESNEVCGIITSHHRIMEKKGKEKLNLQSGSHKCNVCNHVCQTGQELSLHTMLMHPHPVVATAASANKKTFESTGINKIGAAVDGPYNTMGWQIPVGAPRSAILALPVQQPAQGTMSVAGNPMTGYFSASNTSTGWSLPGTTSSILPAIPLHNEEQNPPEQIAAVAPSNRGHRNINPALFSFSRRQEIAVVPRNAIASSSSTPRPNVATATEPFQATGINNYSVAIDSPANTMGRRLPFFLASRSDTQALPVSWLVHHQTQGMALDGNPLTGHFPAAISTTGWSFPAITSSVLPSIPLQNQEDGCRSSKPALFSRRQEKNPREEIAVGPSNAITISTPTPHPGGAAATQRSQAITEIDNNAAAIDALANTMRRLPFFLTGRSAIHAPPVSMPVHQPTQGMSALVGNPVTGHFPAAMAGNGCSFPATTSSVLPATPLQTQEENAPQGRVVPANELADPSQNQAENSPAETVPGNNGGRTIRLFGTNITEGQKEVKEPTN